MKTMAVAVAAGLLAAGLTVNASAATLVDDGTEWFRPGPAQLLLGWEIQDAGHDRGATELGFFLAGTDPRLATSRIPIFGPEDTCLLELASVNFVTGRVADLDDQEDQAFFTPTGAAIGFYYRLDAGSAGFVAYSVPAFNDGGLDLAATYPAANLVNTYRLDFFSPQGERMTVHLMTGLRPAAVPIPSGLVLLGSGLAGLLPLARGRRRA
ncbi:MAG: hypothetical protein AB1634_03960 [Thermodesulfobacteriota bacterium]